MNATTTWTWPVLLLAGYAVAGAAAAEQTFAYPPAGRTPEQQRQDQYECHQWAVEQSHYDPAQQVAQTAPPAEGSAEQARRGGGAVGGAARGAVIAEAADEDTGDAARAGAALGLLRQRRAQAAEAAETVQTQQAAAQQQRAQLQAKQEAYARARNTCYRARGYTVSEG
jgi:hypothetical protein